MQNESEASRNAGQSEGRYANCFLVGHNAYEFVLDFGQFYPERGEPQFHTRIITNPGYAKALLETLLESIQRYEQTFGDIPQEKNTNGPGNSEH
jgi:hypothetical protein